MQPGSVHSYRGYYDHLAIGYAESRGDAYKTVHDLLTALKEADGGMFSGYKGGEYTMHKDTPVWVANWGESWGTAVIGIRDDGWCQRILTTCIN